MEILDLSLCPEHIQTVAEWHHSQWSHLNPTQTLQDRITLMQGYLAPAPGIPRMFLAVENNNPVGTAALIENDLKTHPELSPWLASVFVVAHKRHLGIGRNLVAHATEQARYAGVSRLYLFTPDKAHFYQQMGWEAMFDEQFQGEDITIMCQHLSHDT